MYVCIKRKTEREREREEGQREGREERLRESGGEKREVKKKAFPTLFLLVLYQHGVLSFKTDI